LKIAAKLLIVIFIIYFPIQAYSQCSGGVNPLYDESVMPDKDFYVSSMQQKAYSPVNMNMPDPSPKPLKSQNTSTASQANNSSAVGQYQPEVKLIDVSGKWLVKFNESANRTLDLILFANQERIMGSGTLVEDGTKIPLTASGSVSENGLVLTAKTVIGDYVNQVDRQFDLDLSKSGDKLSGTYSLVSAGKFLAKGNATMTK
jgi:hypothetical protein